MCALVCALVSALVSARAGLCACVCLRAILPYNILKARTHHIGLLIKFIAPSHIIYYIKSARLLFISHGNFPAPKIDTTEKISRER